MEHGAAVLAVKCKATIKEGNADLSINRTLDRSRLWEMQTPQVIRPALLLARPRQSSPFHLRLNPPQLWHFPTYAVPAVSLKSLDFPQLYAG
jgi:hypothetical protein